MNTITLEGKTYALVEERKYGIHYEQHINGIQRESKDFQSIDEITKHLKRKHAICFNKGVEECVIKIRWNK